MATAQSNLTAVNPALFSAPTGLRLRIWDDPILRQVAEPIAEHEFGPQLEAIGQEMIQLMRKPDPENPRTQGVGLAGNQVGLAKRIFVMEYGYGLKDGDESTTKLPPLVVCNPKLELSGPEVLDYEGCLSFPGVTSQVIRAEQVTMEYQRPDGSYAVALLSGFDARIAQHETDHLNGLMFFDRLATRQMRKDVMRRWEKRK